MIDTVELKIEYPLFKIKRPELFDPTFELRTFDQIPPGFNHRKVYKKYKQNPANGELGPNLEIYRRLINSDLFHSLHIRFSFPKLFYGNSLQELRDADSTFVIKKLQACLKNMGIEVTEKVLLDSQVNKIHIGKNIKLPPHWTAKQAVLALEKIDMGGRMDVNKREFKNKGHALYLYTPSRNFIFYDKISDLGKDRNKSVDKYKTRLEKELYKKLKDRIEVLRFEIRLNRTYTFKKWLGKPRMTFKEVLSTDLARKILLKSWEEIMEKPFNQLSLKMEISNEDILNVILARASKEAVTPHSMEKTLSAFGIYFLVNTFGNRIIRDRFKKLWSKNTCTYRLNRKMKEAVILLSDVRDTDIVTIIEHGLKKFERFALPTDLM